jgi:hypothetical protein
MAYDWQAELRNHLVRPNQDLSQGGQFSIRSGGTIILRKGSNLANLNGDAQFNIDLIEIFTLRSAIDSGGVSINQKLASPYGNRQFSYFTAAICDFHNIPHNFSPPRGLLSEYTDAWERVVGYLEEKYAEQPRPQIPKPTKADRIENAFSVSLQTPLYWLGWLFFLLWLVIAFSGRRPLEGLLFLGGLWLVLCVTLSFLGKLLALPARLALPRRLARFILLTLGNQQQPPTSPPDESPGPPPPGPPPSGEPPLPDGIWLGGLDEEPPAQPQATPAGPPPPVPSPPATPARPAQPAAAAPPEPELPIWPTTPMARLDERQQAILQEITEVAKLLDSAFNIPIINKSVGIDPLLGTVWGLGDAVSFLPATYIILRSTSLGLPSYKLVRMLRNVLIDTGIGLIPIVGQATDFFIKANIANLNIIHEHFGLPPYKRPR